MDDMTDENLIESRNSINNTVIELKNSLEELDVWQKEIIKEIDKEMGKF